MKLINDHSETAVEIPLHGSMIGHGLDRLELSATDIVKIYQDLSSGSEVKIQGITDVFEQLTTRISAEAWKTVNDQVFNQPMMMKGKAT